MKRSVLPAAAAAVLLLEPLLGAGAEAQPAIRGQQEQVQFAAGASSRVISGVLKGDQFIDYKLRAAAGQTLSVTLKPSNVQTYFNFNPPGAEEAMFIGSTSGNRFRGLLPSDGDYTIRVYLMRPAARRNETSRYSLDVGVSGLPLVPLKAAQDALIPGTPFHASASIPCFSSIGPKVGSCEAFVIRRGFDGTATVEVRWPGGLRRHILFVKGRPVAADLPEAVTLQRKGDVSIVSLGSLERFEIPDTLLSGG